MSEAIIAHAPQGTPPPDHGDRFTAVLALADDNMVMAHRLSEWISNAPDLEEDITLGNFALDHLGVARALYSHAGGIEGAGRDEDDLAMKRSEREYTNLLLVEQPNGDFAHTMARQLLFDAYQIELWSDLSSHEDPTLAGIAAKALKEARYHFRHSTMWVTRLGDGTEESHRRMQAGIDGMWRFTAEMFEEPYSGLRDRWESTVGEVFTQATLSIPEDPYQRAGGRSGFHTEHLGFILAELQWMERSYPGLEW